MLKSEDSLAKKLSTSGRYLCHSIVEQRKNNIMFQALHLHVLSNDQLMPKSEDSLAKKLSTPGRYLCHSIVEQRKNNIMFQALHLHVL